ncbi:PDZ domain-containing protein [Horticoccus luteus]|uniref:PDZ domain-containing protein n=1 Tax=Horticoccus luteus TaxID=2862869 RepID=A0A8F9TVZ3_9BACT|nr:S41 family peptidase [Horticoccus luteus]QYM79318.1 PDZ domain-containing protein [Horticoccus luteus]
MPTASRAEPPPILVSPSAADQPASAPAASTAADSTSPASPSAAPADPDWPDLRQRTFDEVWTTVNESYFDPTFGGVDWDAVRAKYAAQLPAIADKAALCDLLRAMLGELRRTHFSILPREAAVFTPAERSRIGTIGADFTAVDGQVIVRHVRPASPAAAAGIHPGDVVLKTNTADLATLATTLAHYGLTPTQQGSYLVYFVTSWSRAAVGTALTATVASPDAAPRELTVTCAAHDGEWSEPVGSFPAQPLEFEAHRDDTGLAYLRLNVFAPSLMRPLRAFVRQLHPGDGLILDLRANPGGLTAMAPGIVGLLSDHQVSLGRMILRAGEIGFEAFPQSRAFLGPVAVLIDGGSASTSEILAAGLQATHRARLFGEPSAGAALPSSFKTLPTGDLFQYAIADVQTPTHHSLEGRGVAPDIVVATTRADLAAGRDPVLETARAWLHEARNPPAPVSAATAPAP